MKLANAMRELAATRAERESYARIAKELTTDKYEITKGFVRYHFLKKREMGSAASGNFACVHVCGEVCSLTCFIEWIDE